MANLTIFTDGGSRGNPGPAAVGFVIKKNDALVVEQGVKIEEGTNNTAEYMAVIKSLEWLLENKTQVASGKDDPLQIQYFLDSNLVVNQLMGKFSIKQAHLRLLAQKIHSLSTQLKASATYTHIPREKNARADELLNQAFDQS